MSAITPWLVVAALFVTLCAVVYSYFRDHRADKKEINNLKNQLSAQKRISQELSSYIKEVTKIKGDESEVANSIKEAENDEEVLAIIAGLVSNNNDRVRK